VKVRAFLAAAVVLSMVTSAQAVSLVVMAVNSSLPVAIDGGLAGYKGFTIGVQVTAADLTAPGVGANPVLLVQNVTFQGDQVASPYQSPNIADPDDVQTIQSSFINLDSKNKANQVAPSKKSGPDVHQGVATSNGTQQALEGSSWWYSGGASGLLSGINNSAAGTGTITSLPAADGSGVYQIGGANQGTQAVGGLGYLWTQQATGIVSAGGVTGADMSATLLYGPTGAPGYLTAAPLANQFVGGVLTVPLAYIVANGNLNLGNVSDGMGGYLSPTGPSGTFLEVGQAIYNLLGGSQGVDPKAYLNFATGTIVSGVVPEPGTFVLAGMGALALAMAWRRRK
jgi:hypothetical protein